MNYLGDFAIGKMVDVYYDTANKNGERADFSAGLELADFRIYKDGVATMRSSTSGWTLDENVDALTGVHVISIDLADNTDAGFYVAGSNYAVILYPDTETLDAEDIGVVLATFSIQNRYQYGPELFR